MGSTTVRGLRDELDRAMEKHRFAKAVALLERLEQEEPRSSRWPHRLGDLHRRLGDRQRAVEAYERAVARYQAEGFLARAVAMAKTLISLDPSRSDVLQRLQPGRASVPASASHAARADVLGAATSLKPASNAAHDEVRFEDSPPHGQVALDLSLEELEDVPAARAPGAPEPDPTAERLAALPMFALFADVPPDALHTLAARAELVEVPAGATVVRAGDPADALYGIVEGRARVRVPGLDRVRVPLGEGDLFGEACLLHDEPRHADVLAETALTALRVPKAVLDELVHTHPEVGRLLLQLLTRRLLANLLRTSPLFSVFDAATRRDVARLFEIRKAPAGTVLLERGKRSDGLYISLMGKLSRAAEGAAPRTLLAGSVVGQASLLSAAPAREAVRAETDAVLLRLPAARFLKLATQFPAALERLSDNTQQLEKMAI